VCPPKIIPFVVPQGYVFIVCGFGNKYREGWWLGGGGKKLDGVIIIFHVVYNIHDALRYLSLQSQVFFSDSFRDVAILGNSRLSYVDPYRIGECSGPE
jgi:hypothetical protein